MNKKSIIFLINGLGIEKPGSYSIAIDQCMPNLSHLKETSYFTTAIIDSLEYRTAYEQFFLGDTSSMELDYIHEKIINEQVRGNPTFISMQNHIQNNPNTKLHVFIEPQNSKVVEEINTLISLLGINNQVYLHLILTQQTVNEYAQLSSIINYIKYHINSNVTVGSVIGKESFSEELNKNEMDQIKKLFFLCSAERWSDTDKKLNSLKEEGIRPCDATGFCTNNNCTIENNDAILFFNTKRTSYDKFIRVINENAGFYFKTDNIQLPMYSIIQLDTKYNIYSFAMSIEYEKSLVNLMTKSNNKALIITSNEHIELVNFLANGLNYKQDEHIQFADITSDYFNSKENLLQLIDNSGFSFFIFDYHMDVSKTINDLKEQLTRIDKVLGLLGEISENRHSLFITSLYGLKKELPIAPYDTETVTLDYELQIPIFFYDYTYPKSKYTLYPGQTNNILQTAVKCIWDSPDLESLIGLKGIINNLFGKK